VYLIVAYKKSPFSLPSRDVIHQERRRGGDDARCFEECGGRGQRRGNRRRNGSGFGSRHRGQCGAQCGRGVGRRAGRGGRQRPVGGRLGFGGGVRGDAEGWGDVHGGQGFCSLCLSTTLPTIKMAPKKETKAKKPKVDKADKSPKKPRVKKEKREGEPARPKSAWMLWLAENRQRIKDEGFEGKETMVECGRQWKELSDDDKAPFVEEAKGQKETYKQEMEEFEAAQ